MAEPAVSANNDVPQNPFLDTGSGFFEGGDRRACLDQLRHLSRWSGRVLLVTGPAGIGKSTLFRQLSANLDPGSKAARLSGQLIHASREVLMAVAQGFGIAVPADANSQLLRELVGAHVREQQAADRACLTLMDDADIADPQAIAELCRVVAASGMHLVLFGDVRCVPMIEKAARAADIDWHEMRLPAFSEADTRAYLEWRFAQARYAGRLPFASEQIRDLHKLSEGLPGRVNQMANVLLVKLQSGTLDPQRRRFPARHRALVLILLALVAVAYLLGRQQDRAAELAEGAGEMDAPAPALDVTLQPVPAPDAAGTAGQAMAQERSDAPAVQTPAEASAVEASAVVEAPAARDGPADAGEATGPAPAPVAADQRPAGEGADPEASTAQEAVDPGAEGPAQEDFASLVSEPEAAQLAAADDATVASPGAAAAQAPAGGLRDARWLLAQPADSYTLQLIILSSRERVEAFVERHERTQDFASFRLQRDDALLHVLVHGVYPDRQSARSAAAALEGPAAELEPWIRPMSQIQAAIRSTPQR